MRHWFLVAALSVAIVGCGGGSGAPKGTRVLVYGSASGPIFDALRARYSVTPYRPGMPLGPGRLLLIDGTTTTASQLRDLGGIDVAMKSNSCVLVLNATHEHKVALTQASDRIGAYVNGSHFGYLVTPMGRAGVDIVHAGASKRRVRTHKSTLRHDGTLTGRLEEKTIEFGLEPALTQRFVQLVDDRLKGVFPASRDGGSDPPSGVARYTACVTDSFIDNGSIVPGQTTTQNVTFFFNVYENDYGSNGQFQWLVAYATGLVDPGAPAANDERMRGWFQTGCEIEIMPDPDGNGGLLQNYETGPASWSDSYQSRLAFPLIYGGGTEVYLYALELPGSPQAIPGWSLFFDATSSNGWSWNFSQTSPYGGSSWENGFTHGGLVLDWTVKDMNPTSINQFPIYVGAIWQTTSLTTEGIVMLYGIGSTYDQLHAKYDSPGIYSREHTPITTEPPDPSSVTLLFGRATQP